MQRWWSYHDIRLPTDFSHSSCRILERPRTMPEYTAADRRQWTPLNLFYHFCLAPSFFLKIKHADSWWTVTFRRHGFCQHFCRGFAALGMSPFGRAPPAAHIIYTLHSIPWNIFVRMGNRFPAGFFYVCCFMCQRMPLYTFCAAWLHSLESVVAD